MGEKVSEFLPNFELPSLFLFIFQLFFSSPQTFCQTFHEQNCFCDQISLTKICLHFPIPSSPKFNEELHLYFFEFLFTGLFFLIRFVGCSPSFSKGIQSNWGSLFLGTEDTIQAKTNGWFLGLFIQIRLSLWLQRI